MIDYLMLINRVYWLAEQGITEKMVILGIFSTFIFVFLVIFKNINFKEMVIMKNKKNSVFYISKNSIIDKKIPNLEKYSINNFLSYHFTLLFFKYKFILISIF